MDRWNADSHRARGSKRPIDCSAFQFVPVGILLNLAGLVCLGMPKFLRRNEFVGACHKRRTNPGKKTGLTSKKTSMTRLFKLAGPYRLFTEETIHNGSPGCFTGTESKLRTSFR